MGWSVLLFFRLRVWFRLPFERRAIAVLLVLVFCSIVLVSVGDRSRPTVRWFNWSERSVGADAAAMLFTFSRPMDAASIESSFQLTPSFPGRFSWAGRRLAFTPELPLPYGLEYTVQLLAGKEKRSPQRPLVPFQSTFRTHDRAFAYLGVDGEEEGRLLLYNLTRQQQQMLTPPDWVVLDFLPYPHGDRILFSAIPRQKTATIASAALYSVTTGLNYCNPEPAPCELRSRGGEVQEILSSQDYQNLAFDLSADGQTIIVLRSNQKIPNAALELWKVPATGDPTVIQRDPGGEFRIAPDNNSLVIAQGQGLAVLPLEAGSDPLDFLPQFGRVLGFSRDGTQAATVRFNSDFRQSLFWVDSAGKRQELRTVEGEILSADFAPNRKALYSLLSETDDAEFLSLFAFDLKTSKPQGNLLLKIPRQGPVNLDLAPDGLAVIFDQPIATPTTATDVATAASPRSQLWVLPLTPPSSTLAQAQEQLPQPEALPLQGVRPRWVP
ncbi:Ig-like domain-containing protein [Synechococcus elongatus]|uniref:Ig-like domain-containing protein n=1 Tax=Synechococcus elongatus PCC 11801 TaxID=2219813 RepID=A0AAN1UVF3_SYNEL|nr:Ig-like domain-containing protein [Synechococcus elongatus]